jgi:uncharacterized membrane protein
MTALSIFGGTARFLSGSTLWIRVIGVVSDFHGTVVTIVAFWAFLGNWAFLQYL